MVGAGESQRGNLFQVECDMSECGPSARRYVDEKPPSKSRFGAIGLPPVARLIWGKACWRTRLSLGCRHTVRFSHGRADRFHDGITLSVGKPRATARSGRLGHRGDRRRAPPGWGRPSTRRRGAIKRCCSKSQDFAHGTSSRSTKLIHGGVRYLAQGNVSLVREALAERGILLRNAPHLVHPRDFVVPAYHWHELPYYGTGLKLYDLLAGLAGWAGRTGSRGPRFRSGFPRFATQGLRGGIVYTDGQFDDSRLAITLARTLADLGGTALN